MPKRYDDCASTTRNTKLLLFSDQSPWGSKFLRIFSMGTKIFSGLNPSANCWYFARINWMLFPMVWFLHVSWKFIKNIEIPQPFNNLEHPWMMAIMLENETLLCGGLLINPQVVLTTAHNIAAFRKDQLRVRGGKYNTHTTGEICEHVDRKVEKMSVHPGYKHPTCETIWRCCIWTSPFNWALPSTRSACLQRTWISTISVASPAAGEAKASRIIMITRRTWRKSNYQLCH